MVFEQWDVVVVPFPFADESTQKRRPALVVSTARDFGDFSGHSVLAMITSAGHQPWPLDVPISDLTAAGLPAPSLVRMKLFTIDDRLVERRVGSLAATDAAAVADTLRVLLRSG
ncbi:MAG: type II toxin-antitoxin system PemK/MazF family toxin [Thermoleophilia bacterium]|nr:type II toxin-antitoxin system PemK/MazF family toxin [Thermoleophilia bacterium]